MPNDTNREADNISSGGPLGWLGIDQIDWGGEAGMFFECWKINPCCGCPDPIKMLCCFVCWCYCGCCSVTKMYASSVGQDCAFVPHCLMMWFLPCVTSILLRTNLRNRLGVKGNIVGDCICVWCCGCCSQCQECRAVSTQEWNMADPITIPQIIAPEIILLK